MTTKNTEEKSFSRKVYYIDIDETICDYPETHALDDTKDYSRAIPNYRHIAKINALYEAGHTVIYWTARGSRSKINWLAFTVTQLSEWGVKYSQLRCDKPYYDVFVDDRTLNSIDQL